MRASKDIDLILGDATRGCLVVGDIILDKYIFGDVTRISPEAPIPVLSARGDKNVLGGAANVAGNVVGYNVPTYLSGVLGDDKNGILVKKILQEKSISYVGIESNNRRTTIKSRLISMNQQLVRIDEEDCEGITNLEADALIGKIEKLLDKIALIILSDYNKGVCTSYLCERVINICNKKKINVIVDPKFPDWTKYKGASLITPNFKEFEDTLGKKIDNEEGTIFSESKALFSKYNIDRILVTRSQYGMTLVNKDSAPLSFKAIQQEVFDVSGAGDTVIASIGALVAKGISYESAVEIANYAAGLSVSKAGTYTVSVEEVLEYINKNGSIIKTKIVDMDTLEPLLREWRRQKEIVVFTNGCFDILHLGHVRYLNEARSKGTKLVVGLNSDSSIRRIKGDNRPINNQVARSEMLAALQSVDAVVIFENDTPEELIQIVKPDYLIKGGDYAIEDIVGREYAQNVLTIPLTEGFSTTSLINRIKETN